MVPKDLKYTASHEWVALDGDIATIGITDHAQHELGDIVFVELPAVDSSVAAKSPFGSIESVKAASDVYSPVSGTVVEINESLKDAPETINKDAFGEGWMIKVRLANPAEMAGLLDAAAYEKTIA